MQKRYRHADAPKISGPMPDSVRLPQPDANDMIYDIRVKRAITIQAATLDESRSPMVYQFGG